MNNAEIHGFLTRTLNELKAQRSLITKLEKQIKDDKKETESKIKKLSGVIDSQQRHITDLQRKVVQARQDFNEVKDLAQRTASRR